MKCVSCKNELPDGSVFCMHCGTALPQSAEKERSEPVGPSLAQYLGWWVVFALILQCISGCSSSSAGATLNSYLDATLHNRPNDAYNLLSSDDRSVQPLSEYAALQKVDNGFAEVMDYVRTRTSYKIDNLNVQGNSAEAKV